MSDKHLSVAFRRYVDENRGSGKTLLERLLAFIGADVGYADDILGDLIEERTRREEQDGARSASMWYAREALIAIPHLTWNAIHHGGPRGRARVTGLVAGLAFAVTAVVTLLRSIGPVPARLEVDGQIGASAAGVIIVNSVRPVILAMRATDANGIPMKTTGVRYQKIWGAAIPVSATGVVTCSREGDVILRASLRGLTTRVRIKCRPVHEVQAHRWIHFTAGSEPQNLPFVALDADGITVDQLAGELRIKDSSIAKLVSGRIHPMSPGNTDVTMRLGDVTARTHISVYEPLTSLEGLRADQTHAIAPVRLERGGTIRWSLRSGQYWLQFHAASTDGPVATLQVDGPALCTTAPNQLVERVDCLVRGPGASVRITHPGGSTSTPVIGGVSIEHHR